MSWLNDDLRVVYAIWLRELKVWQREKSRVVGSVITPILWLAVFGSGLSGMNVGGIGYQQFIYPGILAMSILFTSIFFGVYIIWDRKIDFLKEVLAAPASRTAVFFGKVVGGSTDAMLQATLLLVVGVFFGMHFTILQIVLAYVVLLLLSFATVSIGLGIGSQLSSPEGFSMISSFVIWPMFFLSGALYPINNLPAWLGPLVAIDPVTYGVDALRAVLLGASSFPLLLDIGVLAAFTAVMVALGGFLFSRMK